MDRIRTTALAGRINDAEGFMRRVRDACRAIRDRGVRGPELIVVSARAKSLIDRADLGKEIAAMGLCVHAPSMWRGGLAPCDARLVLHLGHMFITVTCHEPEPGSDGSLRIPEIEISPSEEEMVLTEEFTMPSA